MTADEIREKKREFMARYGPWTAHCIHLGEGVYTFDVPQTDSKLRRFVQIAADVTGKPLDALRVLDLACLEGHYGIEFALHGAQVLAIEGRETNLAKARFAKEMLSLDRLELALEDVRHLDVQRHGRFDVVLCLGILYHLDTPDAMDFVESLSRVCTRVAIIDTHISLSDDASFAWKDKTYWGAYSKEHDDDATPEQKLASLWYSLDNPRSFKLTRASLCNLLRHVGFTSVYECMNPYEYHYPNWPHAAAGDSTVVWKDRLTLVAIKGQEQRLLSSPVTDGLPEIDRPERPEDMQGGRSRPTQ
ncbi:MAG TPA: class I SAM-dependent methyltransferase [Thermoanaerobaculia bacterium]|nr:class I SAM-dependent methyltransferase [Thermoanaerobaculia bacterium]